VVIQTLLQRLAAAAQHDPIGDTLMWVPSQPTNSLSPGEKGTLFYWMGIAAFVAHDYQSAAFFFDTAASEDFKVPDTDRQPAHLFMCLDPNNPNQAARQIVQVIVQKLEHTIDDYNRRDGATQLSLDELREHFLRRQMSHRKKHRRTLITTLISFLAEWDYRSRMIDLKADGSKEPFFTHLFRGCLLFESLLKSSKLPPPTKPRPTLANFLNEQNFKQRLGIDKIVTGCDDFAVLVRSLRRHDRSLQTAIQCTAQVRNTLGHNLVWATTRLNRNNYDLLANNILSSCLHAISTLYVRP